MYLSRDSVSMVLSFNSLGFYHYPSNNVTVEKCALIISIDDINILGATFGGMLNTVKGLLRVVLGSLKSLLLPTSI